ncbi:MAG: hypothetical protein JWN85_3964 [Gammaproteobacteria bacterium]|nr:hypothetical protein [Gammaproteobacteria bacterium]
MDSYSGIDLSQILEWAPHFLSAQGCGYSQSREVSEGDRRTLVASWPDGVLLRLSGPGGARPPNNALVEGSGREKIARKPKF